MTDMLPEQPPVPALPPQEPESLRKPMSRFKKCIIGIALTLILISAGMEVYRAVDSGQPVNWDVMERIIDRLLSLLSF